MPPIKTGSGLWRQLTKRAGLNLRTYDSGVEVAFRKRLDLPNKGNVATHLTQRKTRPEPVMGGFLNSIQPFSFMFKDILALIEAVGRTAGKGNLLIEFDFEEGKKFNVDLDTFRQQVEYISRAVRPLEIDRWTYDRCWSLWRALGENVRDDVDVDVRTWGDEYHSGVWPERDLQAPRSDNVVLDEYIARAWQVRHAMIEGARQVGPRRSDLTQQQDAAVELELVDGGIELSNEVIEFLRRLHSDHWTVSLAEKAYKRAAEARYDPELANRLTTELRRVLENPLPERRALETTVLEIEDILSLPVWQRRYELYSIWVLTQIVEALGGAQNFDFMLEGEVFHIPFSAKLLAILKDSTPELRVWSEVRFPLSKPRGKTRKAGMQPDYTLTVDTEDPPSGSFALVECKQYLRASVKNFSDAVIDYATGQPHADVALVNYGPAGPTIAQVISPELASRITIIGDLHPLNPESEVEFHEWIRRETEKVIQKVSPISLPPDGPSASKPLSNVESAQIELRWNATPRDLDLHVFVASETVVNYRTKGTMDSWPWMQLDQDVTRGFGPEIIRIGNNATQVYRVKVHTYTQDALLTQSAAVVTVTIYGKESKVFNCPSSGEGTWWHVCDLDFTSGLITEVNTIHS
jgi:hypothetical protein